jgi:uncharacterized repeat protein (TIGR04138 family)
VVSLIRRAGAAVVASEIPWIARGGDDIFTFMPPPFKKTTKEFSLTELASDVGLYPPEAFEFIQQGLAHTVQQIHGQSTPKASRHVTGQDLCEGLREYAVAKWGYLARTVLRRWNITSTLDFGRIVFALVEVGQMQKTDDDTLDDFKDVYDFRAAFETGYKLPTDFTL